MFCNLDGFRASDNPPGTVLADVVITTTRPDLVIMNLLVELTFPFNSYKCTHQEENCYLLMSDLEIKGFSVSFLTIEIGTLGHFLPSTLFALHLPVKT